MDSKLLREALQESPPPESSKSPMENALELTTLSDIGPDIFTNTRLEMLHAATVGLPPRVEADMIRECWHPPASRGVFGGAVIAQSLVAAQATIPPPSPSNGNAAFLIHSMHCYFIMPGVSTIPILYHVERVREGRSFMTRTVQARQRGKCIFTTTCSFVREDEGQETLDHGWEIPEGAINALEKMLERGGNEADIERGQVNRKGQGLYVVRPLPIFNRASKPHTKRLRYWYRARGTISEAGGQNVHLGALAYMSDNYFIGSVPLVHGVPPFSEASLDASAQKSLDAVQAFSKGARSETSPSPAKPSYPTPLTSPDSKTPPPSRELVETISLNSSATASNQHQGATIGIIVSLDHTIYFHRPREIRADEWLCSEMESPWAGAERGLVTQRIWNRQGRLVATCMQEGLVRLKQNHDADATDANGNANGNGKKGMSKL